MSNRQKGIICITFSAFCFAFMNAFVRLAGDIPSIQKSFFRNLIALIFALIILIKNRTPLKCEKENFIFLLIRAVLGTMGILCNFYAVDHLMLADASMLNKMSPFFTLIFSYLFLKEKLSPVQVGAVVTAFLGTLLIIKPDFSDFSSIPAFIGLIGGICAGGAYTAVRYLGKKGENSAFIVFFFSGFSCAVTLPYLIFSYHSMTAMQTVYLLLAGLAASGGQFGITKAYFYAPSKEISVYDYSQIIFAALLGFIIFGQIPDIYSIIGYAVICSTAVYMFFRTNKKSSEH
ncbi:MAG TPA: EamA family transporter [Ruminococcus sp.]|nr:EamA family transporter [Ruminococcus sp.]